MKKSRHMAGNSPYADIRIDLKDAMRSSFSGRNAGEFRLSQLEILILWDNILILISPQVWHVWKLKKKKKLNLFWKHMINHGVNMIAAIQPQWGPLTTSQLLLLLQGIIMNCSVLNHVYWIEYRYLTVNDMLFLCVWWWLMLSNKISDSFWLMFLVVIHILEWCCLHVLAVSWLETFPE